MHGLCVWVRDTAEVRLCMVSGVTCSPPALAGLGRWVAQAALHASRRRAAWHWQGGRRRGWQTPGSGPVTAGWGPGGGLWHGVMTG